MDDKGHVPDQQSDRFWILLFAFISFVNTLLDIFKREISRPELVPPKAGLLLRDGVRVVIRSAKRL